MATENSDNNTPGTSSEKKNSGKKKAKPPTPKKAGGKKGTTDGKKKTTGPKAAKTPGPKKTAKPLDDKAFEKRIKKLGAEILGQANTELLKAKDEVRTKVREFDGELKTMTTDFGKLRKDFDKAIETAKTQVGDVDTKLTNLDKRLKALEKLIKNIDKKLEPKKPAKKKATGNGGKAGKKKKGDNKSPAPSIPHDTPASNPAPANQDLTEIVNEIENNANTPTPPIPATSTSTPPAKPQKINRSKLQINWNNWGIRLLAAAVITIVCVSVIKWTFWLPEKTTTDTQTTTETQTKTTPPTVSVDEDSEDIIVLDLPADRNQPQIIGVFGSLEEGLAFFNALEESKEETLAEEKEKETSAKSPVFEEEEEPAEEDPVFKEESIPEEEESEEEGPTYEDDSIF